ncbi:MAG: FlgD immunoglobulin-like domain containing protein [bacterium]
MLIGAPRELLHLACDRTDRIIMTLPTVNLDLLVLPLAVGETVTSVRYLLDRSRSATLTVYDLAGRRLAVLARGWQQGGEHWVQWDGSDRLGKSVASGTYLLRLETEGVALQRKVVLLH